MDKNFTMKEPRPIDRANKLSTWMTKFKRESGLYSDEYYPIIAFAYTNMMKKLSEKQDVPAVNKHEKVSMNSILKIQPEDAPICKDDIEKAAEACGYTITWIPALSRHPGYPN